MVKPNGVSPAAYATDDGTHGGGGQWYLQVSCGGGSYHAGWQYIEGFIGMDAIKLRYSCINTTKYPITLAIKRNMLMEVKIKHPVL